MRTPLLFALAAALNAGSLPDGVRFLPGPVNGLLITDKVLVYGNAAAGADRVSRILFTEARRDVVWAGARFAASAQSIAPAAERDLFENPGAFLEAIRERAVPRLFAGEHEGSAGTVARVAGRSRR